jgi:hypothetical protein
MTSLNLTLLVGRMVATPAPAALMSALRSVTVTTHDRGPSGFQLQFEIIPGVIPGDYSLLTSMLLAPFNRVVLVVTLGAVPRVIMDGLITEHELIPGRGAQPDSIAVTGSDVTVAMDLQEKSMPYPGMNDSEIVEMILAEYVEFGLEPIVIPTSVSISDTPEEVVNQQVGTDLKYINWLACRNGYIFQIQPGPLPLTNMAYFGPPRRASTPHKAITINQPPGSNVDSIQFSHNALAATKVKASVQDTLETDLDIPIETFMSTRMPPLAREDPLMAAYVRLKNLSSQGMDPVQAEAKAQGITDASTDRVLTATGELDVLAYQDILKAPGLVGVRGAGLMHDGMYYVAEVTHTITPESYKQRFTLTREGFGTDVPAVLP